MNTLRNNGLLRLATFLLLGLLALQVGLACGTSATSTPRPTATLRPTATAAPQPTTAPTTAVQPRLERVVIALDAPAQENNWTWLKAGTFFTQHTPTMENLIGNDLEGKYLPRLATRWEGSADAKTWTFFLREGVPFQFGWGDLTADDVVHSRTLPAREDSLHSNKKYWSAVDAEAIDDLQVAFHLKNGDPDFEWFAAATQDLLIQSAAQWAKEGKEGVGRQPAGTGPYQYVSRAIGQNLVFERVPYKHWRITPDFRELELKFAREPATRLAMLLVGEAHASLLPTDLTKLAVDKGLKAIKGASAGDFVQMIFGGSHALTPDKFDPKIPWHNVKVREALNRAINRQELLDQLFGEKAIPTVNHLFHPSMAGWNPDWEKNYEQQYGYDPDRAKTLLAEAGYAGGFDIRLPIFAHRLPEVPQITEAVSIYWNRIGVNAKVEELEWSKIRSGFRTKTNNGIIWAMTSTATPPRKNLGSHYYSKSGSLHAFEAQYIDDRYEKLVETIDPTERARLIREIGDYVYNEYTVIPIAQVFTTYTVDPKVIGAWKFPSIGFTQFGGYELIQAAQ